MFSNFHFFYSCVWIWKWNIILTSLTKSQFVLLELQLISSCQKERNLWFSCLVCNCKPSPTCWSGIQLLWPSSPPPSGHLVRLAGSSWFPSCTRIYSILLSRLFYICYCLQLSTHFPCQSCQDVPLVRGAVFQSNSVHDKGDKRRTWGNTSWTNWPCLF